MTASLHCRCGRPLSAPESVARGIGPVCARRLGMTAQPEPIQAKPTRIPGRTIPGQTALPLQLDLDAEQNHRSVPDVRTGDPL